MTNNPPDQPSEPTPGGQDPHGSTPPGPPQYGQAPSAPPPYGQPTYGQPPQGQPYGSPPPGGFGGTPPGGQEPSKGLSIAALVLAIFGCVGISWLVSVVLAVMALVRVKQGRAGGKGLAIAALVIDVIWALVGIALVVLLVVVGVSGTSAEELDAGECITATGLAGEGDTVEDIEVVSCSEGHDGEVVANLTLAADDVEGYGDQTAHDLCLGAIQQRPELAQALVSGGLTFIGLTDSGEPDEGDALACIAFNADGSELTGPLVP